MLSIFQSVKTINNVNISLENMISYYYNVNTTAVLLGENLIFKKKNYKNSSLRQKKFNWVKNWNIKLSWRNFAIFTFNCTRDILKQDFLGLTLTEMKYFENKRRFFDKIVIRERNEWNNESWRRKTEEDKRAIKFKNKGKVPQKAMSNKCQY